MSNQTNGERLARLETQIGYVVEKVDHLEHKLDGFLDNADGKYASKKKVQELEAKTDKINLTLAKYGGMVAAAIVIIEILLKVLL